MVTRRYDVSVASICPSWINYPGRYNAATIRKNFDMETASLNDDFGVTFHNAAGNFFSYVDIRDVVSLTERAIEVDFDGHEPFMAVAKENLLGVDTADAVEATYGDLPPEVDLAGDQSAIDHKNARAVLDWEPEHPWHEAEDESVESTNFV
jgi:nucleoside-diphosphate-sugar epimerase